MEFYAIFVAGIREGRKPMRCAIFGEKYGLGADLSQRFEREGHQVVIASEPWEEKSDEGVELGIVMYSGALSDRHLLLMQRLSDHGVIPMPLTLRQLDRWLLLIGRDRALIRDQLVAELGF